MKYDDPKNVNYCATVVKLQDFVELSNCDNVKTALIFGNSVIVSKDVQAGEIGLFFPVETQLSEKFLAENNLFRKPEWGNVDQTQKGYFEQHGRIKAMRFRGHKSEGFWIPISSLAFTGGCLSDFKINDAFDKINEHEICRKYIPKRNITHLGNKTKEIGIEENIVDGQFKFHFDTENLRKNIHEITINDYISLSDKWHGTSAIFSKSLIKRKMHIHERILSKLGIPIQDMQYGLVYSSRHDIKGVDKLNKGENLWSIVANEIKDKIPNGYTIYGEIVGYMPSGAPIQVASGGRPYHYGCAVGEHKFVVYRITTTNIDGKTLELSWPQMKEYCAKYGLEMVHEWFYGPVLDLCLWRDETDTSQEWRKRLLEKIQSQYVNDSMCQFNNNEVPAEGIVVRVDHLTKCESWKLKNFLFLENESKTNDAGIVDIETMESGEI